VAVRAERDDDVADRARERVDVGEARARVLLLDDLVAELARVLRRAVGRAVVRDEDLVDPLGPDVRHDRAHALDLVDRRDQQGVAHRPAYSTTRYEERALKGWRRIR